MKTARCRSRRTLRPRYKGFSRGPFSLLLVIYLGSEIVRRSATTNLFVGAVEEEATDEDDYDFVKEVLEEDEGHDNDYGFDDAQASDQEERKRQREEAAERQRQEAAELAQAQQEAETARIAAEREREFESELAKMSDEKRKKELAKKKRDSKLVKKILKAAEREELYDVLGIKNWNLRIPAWQVNLMGKYKLGLPGWTIKRTTERDIKRAYRSRASSVHPDKNRDGRAQEAFIAVEESASILTQPSKREEYDKEAKAMRRLKAAKRQQFVQKGIDKIVSTIARITFVFRKVLGPFAPSVFVILCLII